MVVLHVGDVTLYGTGRPMHVQTGTQKEEGFLCFVPGVVYLFMACRTSEWTGDLQRRHKGGKERKKKRKKEEEEEEGHRGGIMYGAATEQDEKEGARTSRRESPITCGRDDGAPLSFVGSHSNKTT